MYAVCVYRGVKILQLYPSIGISKKNIQLIGCLDLLAKKLKKSCHLGILNKIYIQNFLHKRIVMQDKSN